MRKLRIAVALLPIAGVLLTGCNAIAPSAATPATTGPSTTETTTAPSVTAVQATTTAPPARDVAACRPATMKAAPATGGNSGQPDSFAVTTAVYNRSAQRCVLKGFPTVAITGLPPASGPWPHKNLTVTPDGTAYPVTLRPGDGAVVTLTFHPATNGTCTSGATPIEGPLVLLGVPDGGIELTMDDGSDFTNCGNTMTATPFEAHQP